MVKPKTRPRHGARNRLLRRLKTFAITMGVLAVIGGIIYGLAGSSIAYNERDLRDVDFTSLNAEQKRAALVEANLQHCGVEERYAIIRVDFARMRPTEAEARLISSIATQCSR